MIIRMCLAVVTAWLFSANANAEGLMLEAGIHFGGDTLVEAQFTNGETDELKAGELISLTVGLQFPATESLYTRVTASVKVDVISAENGDVDFTRVPIDLILLTPVADRWLIGAGITHHNSPEVNADAASIGLSGNVELDNATGIIIAFDYNTFGNWNGDWYIGGRVTLIDYENRFGEVNGNSIGAVIGYMF